MKNQNLLLIFAKNIVLGKVKTRLAKTEGDNFAFAVYKRLIDITEDESLKLQNCDIHVYFSDVVIKSKWPNEQKFVQQGNDLGERMFQAFQHSFDLGYERVIGIGTDLPDLTADIMQSALDQLKTTDTVFGPADDGGYYLIGMNHLIPEIFENKPWSTDFLLDVTLNELREMGKSTLKLEVLNDIDTIEDLRESWLAAEFDINRNDEVTITVNSSKK